MSVNIFNRKDTNVNEHVRLSKRTLEDSKIEENHFYCCCTFQSHSRVPNSEHNSYLRMSILTQTFYSASLEKNRWRTYVFAKGKQLLIRHQPCMYRTSLVRDRGKKNIYINVKISIAISCN